MACALTAAKVRYLGKDLDERLRLCYHESPPSERVLAYTGRAEEAKPHIGQNPLTHLGPVVQPHVRELNDPAPHYPRDSRRDETCDNGSGPDAHSDKPSNCQS